MCKRREAFSLAVLIGRGLEPVNHFSASCPFTYSVIQFSGRRKRSRESYMDEVSCVSLSLRFQLPEL